MTNNIVNVRNAELTVLGTQNTGAIGTVLNIAPKVSGGYTYIPVDFNSGVDGWVADSFVTTYVAPTTPTTETSTTETPTTETSTTETPTTEQPSGETTSIVRVITTDNLNVRSTPNGTKIGSQRKGSFGTITDGTITTLAGYDWVYVDFDNVPDGFVANEFITKRLTTTDGTTIDEDALRREINRLLREIEKLQALVATLGG